MNQQMKNMFFVLFAIVFYDEITIKKIMKRTSLNAKEVSATIKKLQQVDALDGMKVRYYGYNYLRIGHYEWWEDVTSTLENRYKLQDYILKKMKEAYETESQETTS